MPGQAWNSSLVSYLLTTKAAGEGITTPDALPAWKALDTAASGTSQKQWPELCRGRDMEVHTRKAMWLEGKGKITNIPRLVNSRATRATVGEIV